MRRAKIEPETELVARAQAGDQAAYGALVERYQDRVYNTCYRMCQNHADALDMTQTAFLKAYEAMPRFKAEANFYTWLFRIAVNVVLSRRRLDRRRMALSLDASVDEEARPRSELLADWRERVDASAENEQQQLLAKLLDKLEPDFRVAVVLKDVEDLDYATIASIVGVPVGTVKSRIHRGRMMLRELYLREESRSA